MIEYDMKRNGSGYYDETPVKSGVLTGPQPGEIWETSQGKEALVLKNQGNFCVTLGLNDNQHQDTIEVVSRTVKHTNPAMLGYMFNNNFAQYVKNVPEETFLFIMEAVGERLGVTIKVSRAEDDSPAALEENKRLKSHIENLEVALEAYDGQRKALEEKCGELQTANGDLYHELDMAIRDRDAFKAELKACMAELKECQMNAGHADVVATVKADMYETLYKDLLKSCLARGEAK